MTALPTEGILNQKPKRRSKNGARTSRRMYGMAHFYNYYYVGDLNLTADDLGRSAPLLLTFSKVQNGPKGEVLPHLHSHLELFYFESGAGIFEYRDKHYPIKANDLLAVDSKQMHVQYSEKQNVPLVYYCIAVDNLHLTGRNANCLTDRGFFLHSFENKNNLIYRNILRLLDELNERRYSYATKVNAIFCELLTDTVRMVPKYDPEEISESKLNNRKFLNEVKNYISEHYAEDIALDDLAKISYMNKSYFLHQFKKLFNISPMRYLTLVRIEQSKLLLTSTDLSITQIASEVGINNPVYFTEIFTKAIGVSPSAYRKIVTGQIERY